MRSASTVRWLLVTTVLVVAIGGAPVQAETNLNFVLGGKLLDSDDWPVGDSQGSLAFLSTFGPRTWPVQVAIDVVGSGTAEDSFNFSRPGFEIQGEEISQSTLEFDVGVRKIWRLGNARPFVGGGLAIIWAQQERAIFLPAPPDFCCDEFPLRPPVIVSDSDESPGGWVDGGIFWRLGKRFNLGLEARFSAAEVRLSGRDVRAGGVSLGLILGWGWGGGARIVG